MLVLDFGTPRRATALPFFTPSSTRQPVPQSRQVPRTHFFASSPAKAVFCGVKARLMPT